MKKIKTNSDQETFSLGQKIGQDCHGGETFALFGDLGAGKTKFLQGLAEGLGVKETVNSPTFNIMKIYKRPGGASFFCHVDAYRLSSAKDLTALGLGEYLASPETVTAVEWAEKVEEIFPSGTIKIKIRLLAENEREIMIYDV
jgi:tRNA threonylcarbamoyladenosine biosynthesis protein TsaE